ncbi:MAG: hypothetical protein GDA67_00180 [Nitrospira sp. CR1.3]|nr:hypothetical protein [Nitrospira sp. CR1.3]
MHEIARWLMPVCLLAVIGQVNAAKGETVAERFDKALKDITKQCASRKLAPNEVCGEVAKLKPADPLATEEGRFAHSIKIPNPLPADSGYKPGMTPEQYFDHLCKTEAGEFIYKTVENVEGLYMMRPREKATDDMQAHLYALEDPYGYTDWEAETPQTIFVNPPLGAYQFFEIPFPPAGVSPSVGTMYRRYSGYNQMKKKKMDQENVRELRSRFGFTWRGIKRPHDRDLGIVGGELILVDLRTMEVLAVRRGFIRSGHVRNNLTGVWWLGGNVCPTYSVRPGRNKDGDFAYWFITKALIPSHGEASYGGQNATR